MLIHNIKHGVFVDTKFNEMSHNHLPLNTSNLNCARNHKKYRTLSQILHSYVTLSRIAIIDIALNPYVKRVYYRRLIAERKQIKRKL